MATTVLTRSLLCFHATRMAAGNTWQHPSSFALSLPAPVLTNGNNLQGPSVTGPVATRTGHTHSRMTGPNLSWRLQLQIILIIDSLIIFSLNRWIALKNKIHRFIVKNDLISTWHCTKVNEWWFTYRFRPGRPSEKLPKMLVEIFGSTISTDSSICQNSCWFIDLLSYLE